jgi:hypothetical protein
MGGNAMERQGVVGRQCKFNLSWRDPPARVCDVRLTRIVVVVVEMESVRLRHLYNWCEVAVATLTPDTFLGRSLERPTLAGHFVALTHVRPTPLASGMYTINASLTPQFCFICK